MPSAAELAKQLEAMQAMLAEALSRSVTLPSRFRHVPNILALSAKSRDFTIQE